MALEYFTLAEFRALPDTGGFTDARIDAAAAFVVARVEDHVGFSFVARTKTERVPGAGASQLRLPHAPVIALTSVTGRSGSVLTLADLHLFTRSGVVEYDNGSSFAESWYDVVYSAGLSAPPAHIKEACLQVTRLRLLETDSGAILNGRRASSTTDGVTTTFVPPGEGRLFGYPDYDAIFEDARSSFGFA